MAFGVCDFCLPSFLPECPRHVRFGNRVGNPSQKAKVGSSWLVAPLESHRYHGVERIPGLRGCPGGSAAPRSCAESLPKTRCDAPGGRPNATRRLARLIKSKADDTVLEAGDGVRVSGLASLREAVRRLREPPPSSAVSGGRLLRESGVGERRFALADLDGDASCRERSSSS